jgi:hypothetical protein
LIRERRWRGSILTRFSLRILKGGLRETENRAEKWVELSEKTFNFATYARKEFVMGGLDKKREIFAALGQNFLVKDKQVSITANEWFVPIEKAYPALEAEYKRLELDKNLTDTTRNAAFAQLILSWGQALSGLITVLEDKEYMVTLREKMNNIKKVAKFYNYDLLLAKK